MEWTKSTTYMLHKIRLVLLGKKTCGGHIEHITGRYMLADSFKKLISKRMELKNKRILDTYIGAFSMHPQMQISGKQDIPKSKFPLSLIG